MSHAGRVNLTRLILWAAPLAGIACGGGTDVILPALRITTTTTGVEIDPDGYSISIDGQAAQAIGLNATLAIDQIADGPHTLALSGIAGNCVVGGENPQTVSVASGSTTTAAFAITCSAPLGSIQVVTTTSTTGGGETDSDGYSISIDGQAAQPIGLNGTLTVDGIADGAHTIELAGIAGNCGVGGQNPQTVTVVAGSTATLSFEVTCASGTGSIQVVTTTSGVGTDPDGFALLLDGADRGTIGVSATSTLNAVTAGPHSIGLTGLAGNCQISGENPRAVAVSAGGTAQVAFAISCTAPGATTGNLEIVTVTTGPSQDRDGYLFSIDGGAGQPIGTNASVTLSNITALLHTVRLQGLAANCAVTGSNPIGAVIGAGETARVSFAVTCAATTGSLRITITGLPSGTNAAVTVSGPNSYSQAVAASGTLAGLTPGSYGVNARDVTAGNITYTASVSSSTVAVSAGASPTVTVSYTGPAAPTLNLRIDGLYITQSTQTRSSAVPLVAGRDGYLRVFVLANESNSAKPRVQVRLSTSSQVFNIEAPGASTPRQVQEEVLGSSWNLRIPGSLIQSGLSITAEVDPNSAITESNESDNRLPASGSRALSVRAVPTTRIRFVSVQQGTSEPGNVSSANADQLMQVARRLHPLNAVDVDVRSAVFTASAPLQPGAAGDGWGQLVSDLDGLRVAEGSDRTYFGIVKLTYGRSEGLVGIAFQERPTAVGWDDPTDASRVVAHELGHTWGRGHAPCGIPSSAIGTVDGLYPYDGGRIGVFGFDVAPGSLKAPTVPDIMGYCVNPWVSDYTYRAVMDFRQANPGAAVASAAPQPSLMIWGRIVNGRPLLEPAFEVVTRPSLPSRPGPYTIAASGADGSRLFTLSFDVATVEDNLGSDGHFAFALPLSQMSGSRLGSVRLEGPTGAASSLRTSAQLRTTPAAEPVVARRVGENVSLRWNSGIYPMIMVRDPDTGEVLSFARGGTAQLRTWKGELDLDVSDGVRSQRVRLAISRS